MTVTITPDIIVKFVEVCGAIGAIVVFIIRSYKAMSKWDSYDEKIQALEEEQCMQTYVLEAVLDGLHQLGCNGKTTEASEKLHKFINQKAHNQETKTNKKK